MATITNRQPSIKIEYTARNARTTKEFAGDQIAEARHLFAAKLNAGKEPRVLAGDAVAISGSTPAAQEQADPAAPLTVAVATKAAKHTSPAVLAAPGADGFESRPQVAGKVIAMMGTSLGVNAAMVQKLDELYGKPNAAESKGRLNNAMAAIKGWCAQMGIDSNTGKRLPAGK